MKHAKLLLFRNMYGGSEQSTFLADVVVSV
jgi:hypothetical protein